MQVFQFLLELAGLLIRFLLMVCIAGNAFAVVAVAVVLIPALTLILLHVTR